MSLELALTENTAAVKELIAAIKAGATTGTAAGKAGTAAGKAGAAAGKAGAAAGKAGAAKKPGKSVEEAQAALTKIKDSFSLQDARDVLAEFGIAKMSEIKADQAEEVFNAAVIKFDELSATGGDDGDDEGL